MVQVAFANMALSQQQAFKPINFWHAFKDYDGEPINVTEHQDAYEFLTRLQASCMICPYHLCSAAECTVFKLSHMQLRQICQ